PKDLQCFERLFPLVNNMSINRYLFKVITGIILCVETKGVLMKIILVGANGTIGKHVLKALEGSGHEVIKVGKKSGDFQVDIAEPGSVAALYKKVGNFDAVVSASGD